ncbi:hypothetical protein HK100_006574 [Physocladia obscura]|uniref:DNA polymerase epsilon subunit D n=1 Tax=Physocladia obscura TaxID=109957 RepID=A0AAD5T5Z8_9FUNG|nr:hypothetical protein HK100_006574 [Physocladia obscura]
MESTDEQTGTGIDDLSIPKAIVTRILKGSTVSNFRYLDWPRIKMAFQVFNLAMQKEAKDAFTKAIELAKKAGRKTISANDVYEALNSSEFEQFVAAIKHDTEGFV